MSCSFLVFKLDLDETCKTQNMTLANTIPKGRCEWCCKNHLLYEKDYFMIPVSHFLKRSKQDVQRFLGGLLFLASPPRYVLFSAISSFGTKGIVDIFPAVLIS